MNNFLFLELREFSLQTFYSISHTIKYTELYPNISKCTKIYTKIYHRNIPQKGGACLQNECVLILCKWIWCFIVTRIELSINILQKTQYSPHKFTPIFELPKWKNEWCLRKDRIKIVWTVVCLLSNVYFLTASRQSIIRMYWLFQKKWKIRREPHLIKQKTNCSPLLFLYFVT